MDAEVAASTAKSVRYATIASTGSSDLYRDFSTVITQNDVRLEDALAEAVRLYVDRHPKG